MLQRIGWLLVMCPLVGCVTPVAVKEASRTQKESLSELVASVETYRREVKDYFAWQMARQREAYVARMVGQQIDQIASDQASSLGKEGMPPLSIRFSSAGGAKPAGTQPDVESLDFIRIGAALPDAFRFWAENFDLYMKYPGAFIEERQEAMRKDADELERKVIERNERCGSPSLPADLTNRCRSVASLRREASRSPRELSQISVAIDLDGQAAAVDKQLSVLVAQLRAMMEVQAVVDNYITADATIDGKALADAAARGAGTNLDEMPELKKFIEKARAPR